jgi:hypothetical protein
MPARWSCCARRAIALRLPDPRHTLQAAVVGEHHLEFVNGVFRAPELRRIGRAALQVEPERHVVAEDAQPIRELARVAPRQRQTVLAIAQDLARTAARIDHDRDTTSQRLEQRVRRARDRRGVDHHVGACDRRVDRRQ